MMIRYIAILLIWGVGFACEAETNKEDPVIGSWAPRQEIEWYYPFKINENGTFTFGPNEKGSFVGGTWRYISTSKSIRRYTFQFEDDTEKQNPQTFYFQEGKLLWDIECLSIPYKKINTEQGAAANP